MAFVEDTATFFSDFGVDATLNAVSVRGLLVEPYAEAFGGMIAGSQPVFQVASSVSVAEGNTLTIGSTSYTVSRVQSDGTGIVSLVLDKA